MSLVEGRLHRDMSPFSHDLQRFVGNPTMSGRVELARKYPPKVQEVNAAWRKLPKEEKTREVLLDHFQKKFKNLTNPGHYEFETVPQDYVPESGEVWVVADAVLGDSFRGGIKQPFTLDVRSHSMRLISELGQRAISLNLIPGEGSPLIVFDTVKFNSDETWNANRIIREAGPLIASEMFMDIVASFSLPHPLIDQNHNDTQRNIV